jgi:hypothetical protein
MTLGVYMCICGVGVLHQLPVRSWVLVIQSPNYLGDWDWED